jgi:hypothetical protein
MAVDAGVAFVGVLSAILERSGIAAVDSCQGHLGPPVRLHLLKQVLLL